MNDCPSFSCPNPSTFWYCKHNLSVFKPIFYRTFPFFHLKYKIQRDPLIVGVVQCSTIIFSFSTRTLYINGQLFTLYILYELKYSTNTYFVARIKGKMRRNLKWLFDLKRLSMFSLCELSIFNWGSLLKVTRGRRPAYC